MTRRRAASPPGPTADVPDVVEIVERLVILENGDVLNAGEVQRRLAENRLEMARLDRQLAGLRGE